MPCRIDPDRIQKTIDFHGHFCPGLAIGIRAAELALERFDHSRDQDLVCMTETDMCGVDAIQFLTGCTMGKGNLVLKDHGKMAFSFFHRPTSRGFRAVLRPEARAMHSEEMARLMASSSAGEATEKEKERLSKLRSLVQDRYMTLDLEELFDVEEETAPPPRPPRILETLSCDACGEAVMESRTRRFSGRTLCIPCFGQVEQKI